MRHLQSLLGLRARDGMMSPAVVRAMSAAQAAGGLPVTGVCDGATWDLLEGVTASAPTPAKKPGKKAAAKKVSGAKKPAAKRAGSKK